MSGLAQQPSVTCHLIKGLCEGLVSPDTRSRFLWIATLNFHLDGQSPQCQHLVNLCAYLSLPLQLKWTWDLICQTGLNFRNLSKTHPPPTHIPPGLELEAGGLGTPHLPGCHDSRTCLGMEHSQSQSQELERKSNTSQLHLWGFCNRKLHLIQAFQFQKSKALPSFLNLFELAFLSLKTERDVAYPEETLTKISLFPIWLKKRGLISIRIKCMMLNSFA